MNINSGVNIKSIPLQNLPPEAFKVVVGDGGAADTDLLKLYETVPWLFRGTEARANALSGVPFGIHKGISIEGDEVDISTFHFAGNIPDLIYTIARDYILFAQWYIWKGANPVGKVKELRRFVPTSITPKYDEMAGIEEFERKLATKTITIPVNEMIWLMRPSARTELGAGVSDAQVALAAAGVIGNLDTYAASYFANGALMPTLISTTGQVQEVDRAFFKSWIKKITGRGAKNAHTVEVVQGDFKATTLGSPPKDLAAPELNNTKREDIATALGVPQTVLFSNAANYATALQDDLHFYDKTVRPDGIRFEYALNNMLFHPLGYHFAFHWEQMEIYQLQKSQQAQALVSFVTAGVLTKDEVREEIGYEPLEAEPPPPVTPVTETAPTVQEPQQDAPPEEVKAHIHTPVETPVNADLARWQTVATKRLKEGKLAKALDFESAVIRPTLMESIKGALEAVKDAADIKHIFADAMEWASYP
ncbi:MAG: phage portal protein [Chloroflexi bacterium]|nr:phage portal protein [Chloroflexota bacterium]